MMLRDARPRIILFASMVFFLNIHLVLPEELYIFKEEASFLITNTPAPGYIRKMGKPHKELAWRPLPNEMQYLDSYIESIGERYSVSPSLIKAVIQVESNFNPSAVSPKGAKGLMQLMDSTASEYGVRNILDPYENIMGGTKYLRYLLDFFEEDLSLTLSAYNAGLDAVLKFKGIPPFPETINYVQTIFKILESPNKKMNIKDHQKGSNLSMVRDGFGNIIITN